jgi:hypothetical protein
MSATETKRRAEQRRTALITLQDCESEYGPPYTSWRDLVIEGHLPRVQLGDSRRIWVRRADVERLIGAAG